MAPRDYALDGLRGLAALAVAGGHSILAFTGMGVWMLTYRQFADQPFENVMARLGYIVAPSDAAVMVFFVLSGHVLWSMFDRRYAGIESLPRCITERLWRLLPTSIVAGILFGLATRIGYVAPMEPAEVLRTMFILSRDTNGVLWSLQVEIVASILLFGIWAATGGRSLLALLLSFPSFLVFRHTGSQYALFLPAFLLGAAIANVPGALARSPLLLLVGVPILLVSSLFLGHGWEARFLEMAGAVLIVAHVRASQPRWLLSRPMQFLGLVSYPFYLVHGLGIAFAFRNMPWVPENQTGYRIVALFVLSTLAALLLAYVIHRLVERPAMRLPKLIRAPAPVAERGIA
ncbi:acyltransferase [Aureimonas sp. ME7]|uniref:acyltransferase family protein n=1 Tax=Aureimonas sp. ME7 TaxID=2744252 RepID=UPI0015F66B5A|nr:acyltransferase [Aureimonas sp. ME7]